MLLNSRSPVKSVATIESPVSTIDSSSVSLNEVFFCPEESQFYSHCLETMVLKQCSSEERVVEFGAGDGSPVINALLKIRFAGLVEGYELNGSACKLGRSKIQQYHLNSQYVIHNQCFFENFYQSEATYLVANPPYIPALDSDIRMPNLHGGADGSMITNRLLSLGCNTVMAMISAYSNPVGTVDYALAQGYQVVDFMISPLPFGYYSSEPKVKRQIAELRKSGKASYSQNIYFLGGVLFKQRSQFNVDLSAELKQVMSVL